LPKTLGLKQNGIFHAKDSRFETNSSTVQSKNAQYSYCVTPRQYRLISKIKRQKAQKLAPSIFRSNAAMSRHSNKTIAAPSEAPSSMAYQRFIINW
jgi:hypothetical protein